ncbi:hypothetical protein MUB24_14170 [Lederbergia sp. NSJ-179]|uniref:hypothetical protein n=1 Tax=Lederbergia sp. NSJ-179 TaxID=2931402 RepID=UPI001FD49212|nr:hypothetical protein [Lederbergia sp. NSJ-179]MCJ7842027.1 hypothetical protein [Lederbergia sp. NSJ-179]
MTIISIDGASAVGKTTTSSKLAMNYGGYWIPEVNALWKSPEPMYPEWFFEKQVERWTIAQRKSSSYPFIVIDIDLFQPLWYNWVFDFTLFGGQSLEFVTEFYRKQLLNRTIGFPDKYFVLYTDEVELRKRKNGDNTRRRSGFEMNLRMIEPQKRYFNALRSLNPDLVCFIESDNTEMIVEKIIGTLPSTPCQHTFSVELFDFIVNWLGSTRAT